MRFARQTIPDIIEIPLRDLAAELHRRGWEILPAGAHATVVSELEREITRAAPERKRYRDVTPTVLELAHLAGNVLPEAVHRAGELAGENIELRDRVHLAEAESAVLAHQIMAPELRLLEHLEDDEES